MIEIVTGTPNCYQVVEVFCLQRIKYFHNGERSVFLDPGMVLDWSCIFMNKG